MAGMSAPPDDADPRPCDRRGAARQDCEPARGETLLPPGRSTLVFGGDLDDFGPLTYCRAALARRAAP